MIDILLIIIDKNMFTVNKLKYEFINSSYNVNLLFDEPKFTNIDFCKHLLNNVNDNVKLISYENIVFENNKKAKYKDNDTDVIVTKDKVIYIEETNDEISSTIITDDYTYQKIVNEKSIYYSRGIHVYSPDSIEILIDIKNNVTEYYLNYNKYKIKPFNNISSLLDDITNINDYNLFVQDRHKNVI